MRLLSFLRIVRKQGKGEYFTFLQDFFFYQIRREVCP